MDILITLPKDLIEKIISGEKTIEVRKRKPKFFNPFRDIVYVVEKGTKQIVLDFSISNFYYVGREDLMKDFNAGKIGIDYDWLERYMSDCKVFVKWEIGIITSLYGLNLNIERLGVKKAPQSFVYVHDIV